MRKDNIIKFPLSKRMVRMSNMKKLMKQRTKEFESKKALLMGSLFSVLTIMVVANTNLVNTSTKAGREVAAINSSFELQRNADWENKLAQRLGQNVERKTASIGSAPSLQDHLIYGELEGKYRISFNDGLISEIHFSDGVSGSSIPKFIKNREQFITQNRPLMPASFEDISQESVVKEGNFIVEKYALMNDSKKVALVEIRLDNFNRFLDLKITQ